MDFGSQILHGNNLMQQEQAKSLLNILEYMYNSWGHMLNSTEPFNKNCLKEISPILFYSAGYRNVSHQ